MDAEHLERKAANIAWLKQAFAEAKAANSRGVVILTQANPGFENFLAAGRQDPLLDSASSRAGRPLPSPTTAFGDYIQTLSEELETFDRPVAFLHGDTHLFRIDKPLYSKKTNRLFENFTRVETFGWPDSHWVRIYGRSRRSAALSLQGRDRAGERGQSTRQLTGSEISRSCARAGRNGTTTSENEHGQHHRRLSLRRDPLSG